MSKQPVKGVGFSDEHIKNKTESFLKSDLNAEKIMSPFYVMEYDGIHATGDHDVITPSSWLNDTMQVWTLDLELSDERNNEIESLVGKIMKENLPNELLAHI